MMVHTVHENARSSQKGAMHNKPKIQQTCIGHNTSLWWHGQRYYWGEEVYEALATVGCIRRQKYPMLIWLRCEHDCFIAWKLYEVSLYESCSYFESSWNTTAYRCRYGNTSRSSQISQHSRIGSSRVASALSTPGQAVDLYPLLKLGAHCVVTQQSSLHLS